MRKLSIALAFVLAMALPGVAVSASPKKGKFGGQTDVSREGIVINVKSASKVSVNYCGRSMGAVVSKKGFKAAYKGPGGVYLSVAGSFSSKTTAKGSIKVDYLCDTQGEKFTAKLCKKDEKDCGKGEPGEDSGGGGGDSDGGAPGAPPASWTGTASGTEQDGFTEENLTYSASYALSRTAESSTPYFHEYDGSGTAQVEVSGEDDFGCAFQGSGPVPVEAQLRISYEGSAPGYASSQYSTAVFGGGDVPVTMNCPGEPAAQGTESVHFEDQSGQQAYQPGAGSLLGQSTDAEGQWQWSLAAQG